ncbi:hypothetical protein SAY86_020224 [Trapa natans]|uniref:Uncharacterized protein n=1 Tax=Trapa natans TaxID=22666 RepID=A0AAN7M134_TRANT|nr:hypothetical protein SAY86_020224 [Trapa natans]
MQGTQLRDASGNNVDIIGSTPSKLITIDSIFSYVTPIRSPATAQSHESLGSSVYILQRDLLHKFYENNILNNGRPRISCLTGVPPQTSVSSSTYMLAAGHSHSNSRLNALKGSVDAKIQAMCKKVRMEKAKRRGKSNVSSNSNVNINSEDVPETEASSSSTLTWQVASDNRLGPELMSESIPEEEFRMIDNSSSSMSMDCPRVVSQESESEGCSLSKIPSFDPELIWEVLAN